MPDTTLANLDKIKHIVVLMMENRSFDQMLGYLSLEGGRTDIDGLQASFSNVHKGTAYKIHHLDKTSFGKNHDPGHEGASVANQLSNNNGGFVDDYVQTHPGDPDFDLVMGYFNASELPTYDFFAKQFCVCDRWFSSVPGSTWPNRLYAMSGMAAGSKDSKTIPFYKNQSFFRHLDKADVSWKFYSCLNPYSLMMTDENYRSSPNFEPFGSANSRYGFVGDALAGTLPSVSWIDPHFFKNDDHPPADIRDGQALVSDVYQALALGPAWDETLLIVTYDEHGGFYDHVNPDAVAGQPDDDDPAFRTYGLRVPAFVISPWVKKSIANHTIFDHTSIIKTILTRFCSTASGEIPNMGKRVAAATHLGSILSESKPRPAPPFPKSAINILAARKSGEFKGRFSTVADGTQTTPTISSFQQGLIAADKLLATTLP